MVMSSLANCSRYAWTAESNIQLLVVYAKIDSYTLQEEILTHCKQCVLLNYPINPHLLCSFKVDGENKYMKEIQELIQPERNTLAVSFNDIENHNSKLSTIIQEEYYRYLNDMSVYLQNTVVQVLMVWNQD